MSGKDVMMSSCSVSTILVSRELCGSEVIGQEGLSTCYVRSLLFEIGNKKPYTTLLQ